MEVPWFFSLVQVITSASVVVVSIRLCVAASSSVGVASASGGVACCLRLCLGWVGAIGGAVGVPVSVVLNLRTPQCLYTCITLVCCPLLVRTFTVCLMLLIAIDTYLLHHLANRYPVVVTRRRALILVLVCWVGSVLVSFAQFIGSDVLSTWRTEGTGDPGSSGLGLQDNWTTSSPPPKQHQDRQVIGQFLPYGGFLSKFYVEDLNNFSYAEIHSSHWGVCAPDMVLSPSFLVYVHGSTVFLLPLLCLLVLYLDLLRRKTPPGTDPPKPDSGRSLVLSLSLLVLLCLPLHILHAVTLLAPETRPPVWTQAAATVLSQLYGLVPPLLTMPPRTSGHAPSTTPAGGKGVCPGVCPGVCSGVCPGVCEAPWSSAKHSFKARVHPDVRVPPV